MKEGKVTGSSRLHKGTVRGTGQQKVEVLEHLSYPPLANPGLFFDTGQESYCLWRALREGEAPSWERFLKHALAINILPR